MTENHGQKSLSLLLTISYHRFTRGLLEIYVECTILINFVFFLESAKNGDFLSYEWHGIINCLTKCGAAIDICRTRSGAC